MNKKKYLILSLSETIYDDFGRKRNARIYVFMRYKYIKIIWRPKPGSFTEICYDIGIYGMRIIKITGQYKKYCKIVEEHGWSDLYVPRKDRDKMWASICDKEFEEPILFECSSNKEFMETAKLYLAVGGK